jgi:hypothetical protein
VAALLVAGSVLYAVHPPFRAAVNEKAAAMKTAVVDVVSRDPVRVRPSKVSSPAPSDEGHPVTAVNGLNGQTYWTFPSPVGNGVPPSLHVDFDRPVALDRLVVLNGARDHLDDYDRPERLRLVLRPSGDVLELTLRDGFEEQVLAFDEGTGVRQVEIEFLAVYDTTSTDLAALTEIEFLDVR